VQDIYNIKKNISMKTKMSAKPDESYYRESHREIGDINATNKIIVFSDPLCPACRNKIPRLIELAKGSPNKFSVYVYHFPLLHVHPSSEFLVKAMIFAKLKGIDILPIVYSTQFPSDAGLDSTLKKLNEELVSQGIKLRISAKDINTADVLKNYNNDTRDAAKLFVSFTPSIYTNLYPDHALDIVEKINKEK
jgi:protein-disulfide isomerase